MLVFRDGVAERYVRGRNRLASPYRYELEIDPEVWFLEDEGYELAVFHSHPETEPRPSRTDRELSGLWAGKPFLIYGLKLEELRAWPITPRRRRRSARVRLAHVEPRFGHEAVTCLCRLCTSYVTQWEWYRRRRWARS